VNGTPDLPGPVPHLELQLIGLLLQWAVGVLLLLFFIQLPRYGAYRSLLWTWIAAWAALVVGRCGEALTSAMALSGTSGGSTLLLQLLLSLETAGRLAFLALVTIGAVQAAGRRVPGHLLRQLLMAVVVVGLLLNTLDQGTLARHVVLFATPVLLFGSAQLLLAAARGERAQGLSYLALGMVLYAALSTLYMLASLGRTTVFTAGVNEWMVRTSGYGLALATVLLGASVVVLVVQDSVLEARRVREEHVRDVSASAARLKGIIEAAGEAIVTFGTDRRVDLANAAAAHLFQVPAGAVVGRHLDDLVQLDHGTWEDVLDTVLQDGPTQVTRRATGRRPQGAAFPVEFTVGALDHGDAPGGGVAILRDLSQRLAAESERELFERRVAESEKMLAIGRVVSGVAHELNNPLAVVLGQSEQLVDLSGDVEVRRGLQLINEQAHRARHIVKDLLAFVRHREDRRESVMLTALAEHVAASQARAAVEHQVVVRVEAERPGPAVAADRLGLEQVVINLLDNAMDAAGPGGAVRLVVRSTPTGGELLVEDNGSGVPDELVPRIFEPFFTTKPVGQGTGLGLAVSLGLLEQHGGTLQLENRPSPGIGARFVIRLSRPETGMVPREDGAPAVPAPPAPEGTVLVVDDEPAVRSTVSRILRRWGWKVVDAASGAEALRVLEDPRAERPSLLLCDLKMPEMTGSELYARLQRDHPALARRTIFVTGDVVEIDTAEFLGNSDRIVVEKPFTMRELATAIGKVLQRDSA
jgi:PAS domain S-box-containing protein